MVLRVINRTVKGSPLTSIEADEMMEHLSGAQLPADGAQLYSGGVYEGSDGDTYTIPSDGDRFTLFVPKGVMCTVAGATVDGYAGATFEAGLFYFSKASGAWRTKFVQTDYVRRTSGLTLTPWNRYVWFDIATDQTVLPLLGMPEGTTYYIIASGAGILTFTPQGAEQVEDANGDTYDDLTINEKNRIVILMKQGSNWVWATG